MLSPESISLVTIGHCDHGKQDYEKAALTSSSTDIDWNKVFCMLKPSLAPRPRLKSTDTVSMLVKDTKLPSDSSLSDEKPDSKPFSKVGKVLHDLKQLFRNIFDKKLEKSSEGKYIEYRGKKTMEHLQDIEDSNPQASLEWESRNLVCYKLARRQKYAKRNITFYVPGTFVGGIFECPLNSIQRKQIFQQFSSTDLLTSTEIACDPSISRPISPLIAQDITNQWLEFNLKSGLVPLLKQTIPYLATPGPLDPRFEISNTPEMFSDTWGSKIEVNEDYVYNDIAWT